MKLQRILHSDATVERPVAPVPQRNPVVKRRVVKKRRARGWIA